MNMEMPKSESRELTEHSEYISACARVCKYIFLESQSISGKRPRVTLEVEWLAVLIMSDFVRGAAPGVFQMPPSSWRSDPRRKLL